MGRRSNKEKRLIGFVLYVIIGVIGLVFGFGGFTYIKLPHTDKLIQTSDAYYSYGTGVVTPAVLTNSSLTVHFLELGNKYTGDCTYIQVGDVDILIDCGSKTSSIATVKKYLDNFVTGDLDYVIVTHAHQDHYAGFATSSNIQNIFDYYTIGTIIEFAQSENTDSAMYKRYIENRNDAREAGARWFTALDAINAGPNGENYSGTEGARSIIPLNDEGTITLQILDQKFYREDAKTENDYSVCCMINQKGENDEYRRFVFTGDLEEDGEASLIELNEVFKTPQQVELYKAGHHGSKTSSSAEFMAQIQPKKVCVCCCAGSPEYTDDAVNQFPTVKFIENIAPYTTEVYITTLCEDYENSIYTSFNGNIAVCSLPEGVVVKCSNNNTVLKDTDWFKTHRAMANVPASWHSS